MATYLITGASRGIGLELATQLVAQPTTAVSTIFVASRTKTDALLSLAARAGDGPHVQWVQLEVTNTESVSRAAGEVGRFLGDKGLDVLINNAGVMRYVPIHISDDLSDTLNINVVGVQNVMVAFLPLLQKGTGKKVANISSGLASIALAWNFPTFNLPYNVSKAALNMLTVQYAKSFKDEGFTFLAIQPGWVKTDIGSSDAHLTPQESVKSILDIISNTTTADNGKFLNVRVPGWEDNFYGGGELPW